MGGSATPRAGVQVDGGEVSVRGGDLDLAKDDAASFDGTEGCADRLDFPLSSRPGGGDKGRSLAMFHGGLESSNPTCELRTMG